MIPGNVGSKIIANDGMQIDSISENTVNNGVQIQGRTSGTAIPAGYVGETKTNAVSSIATNTSTWTTINSITLTEGKWLITAGSYSDNQATQTGTSHLFWVKGIQQLSQYGADQITIHTGAGLETFAAFTQVATILSADVDKTVKIRQLSYTAAGMGYANITAVRIA